MMCSAPEIAMEMELLEDVGEVADQCRALGLEIGDTIIGREGGPGGWWHEAELTLLWLGKEEAVFSERSRSDSRPIWSEPREASNWTLECRDWRKVPNAKVSEGENGK